VVTTCTHQTCLQPTCMRQLAKHLHHVNACHSPLRGGLQHNSVASHQGGGQLADRQVDGVVEGGNAQHDAQGHLCVHVCSMGAASHVCSRVFVHMRLCTCMCVCAHAFACLHVHVQMCVCARTLASVHSCVRHTCCA